MSFRPGLANMASALADPAREAILVALADGRALPAGDLARAAGVSPQSASRHLQILVEGQLLEVWAQSRFRYYRIASEDIAALLEDMSAIASRVKAKDPKVTSGRKVPQSLCEARRCYNHLAGRLGVDLARAFDELGFVTSSPGSHEVTITSSGLQWLMKTGVALSRHRVFRLCMDWTERRPHFAGPVAAALLDFLEERKFVIPDRSERRALKVTRAGAAWLEGLGIRVRRNVSVG